MRVAPAVSVASATVAAWVAVSWTLGLDSVRSVDEGWVSMKLPTAVALGLASVVVWHDPGRPLSWRAARTVGLASGAVLGIVLAVALDLSGAMSEAWRAAFLRAAEDDSPLTASPGTPSMATLAALAALGACGLLQALGARRTQAYLCAATVVLGGAAVAGYLLRAPSLAWHLEGRSTAMAVHTGLALAALAGARIWDLRPGRPAP